MKREGGAMMKRLMVAILVLLPAVASAQQEYIRYTPGGMIYLADGTAAVPSASFASTTNMGLFRKSATQLGFAAQGVEVASVNGSAWTMAVPILISSATGYYGVNSDVYLTRGGVATWQLGLVDSAAPIAHTLQAQGVAAGTSDVAGAALTIKSGTGRGTGAGSALVFTTPSVLTTGNTAQTQVERVRINEQATSIATLAFPLVADATIQYGQTVMPDAGTNDRFDVTTGSATLTIGVLGGVGASAQGTSYPVIYGGLTYVAIAEDAAVTRGHYLLQSATAGYCSDSATVSTDGLNIAKALRSEPVSNVIVHNGCTGSAGCINTALNTPNVGPAGQITLSADVAAAGWVVGEPVTYWNSGGGTPTGLTDGATYWLVSVATTNVTISTTKGGAVLVPSSQGNDATQYLIRLPLAAVSIQ